MKEKLVRKFVEKLDYSYNYKTKNERQNIISELCEIAGIEQLTIPAVVGQSEQLFCEEHTPKVRYDWQKGNCLTCAKKLEAK